jgi:hypothetical protein
VINLQVIENNLLGTATMSEARLSQAHIRNLAEFVIFKMQTSNAFNISLSLKEGEISDDEDLKTGDKSTSR